MVEASAVGLYELAWRELVPALRPPEGMRPVLGVRVTQMFDDLLRILTENGGDVPVSFQLCGPLGQVEMAIPSVATDYSPRLEQQITALVGREHLNVEWA